MSAQFKVEMVLFIKFNGVLNQSRGVGMGVQGAGGGQGSGYGGRWCREFNFCEDAQGDAIERRRTGCTFHFIIMHPATNIPLCSDSSSVGP